MSSSEESDIRATLPSKTKKESKNPITSRPMQEAPKKLSTKEMIHQALAESKSRKGISLYAIKKHMETNHGINIEKLNHLIKKKLMSGVEAGSFVQTKGVGASGSFRLAPKKKSAAVKNVEQPKRAEPMTENEIKKTDKTKKTRTDKDRKTKKVTTAKTKVDGKTAKVTKAQMTVDSESTKPTVKSKKQIEPRPGTSAAPPAKKRPKNMMKRKSIGSIIKAPKMRPKVKI